MAKVVQDFTGYPDGVERRDFRVGEIVADLAPEYIDLLIAKGHVERDGPAPEPAPVPVEPAAPDAPVGE